MSRYRIVLSGEALPGADHDQAVQNLAALFKVPLHQAAGMLDGRAHPIHRELPLEKAEKIQMKLQRIGVAARVEPVPEPPPTTVPELTLEPIEGRGDEGSALRTCPKCGYEQFGGEACENCGVIFAKVLPDSNVDAVRREETEREYSPEELWPEFIALREEAYLPAFQRFHRRGGRFVLTWHWPALFVPFLWALYRKMWGWAALIWLVNVLLPLGVQLGLLSRMADGVLPNGMAWLLVGLLSLVIRLIWPMVAKYLYYRHAMKRLEPIAAEWRGDEAIDRAADAGGVSSGAVVLGIVFYIVSMMITGKALAPRTETLVRGMVDKIGGEVRNGAGESRNMLDRNLSAEERRTTAKLKGLSFATRLWLSQEGGVSAASLTRERLTRELELKPESWRDGWGHEIRLETDASSYAFHSAGADGAFGNADDLLVRNPVPDAN